jgi:hypothetical protein
MRKLALALSALAIVGFAAPLVTSASAETVIVKKHHHDWDRPHHKTVIIKHGHDHDHD